MIGLLYALLKWWVTQYQSIAQNTTTLHFLLLLLFLYDISCTFIRPSWRKIML